MAFDDRSLHEAAAGLPGLAGHACQRCVAAHRSAWGLWPAEHRKEPTLLGAHKGFRVTQLLSCLSDPAMASADKCEAWCSSVPHQRCRAWASSSLGGGVPPTSPGSGEASAGSSGPCHCALYSYASGPGKSDSDQMAGVVPMSKTEIMLGSAEVAFARDEHWSGHQSSVFRSARSGDHKPNPYFSFANDVESSLPGAKRRLRSRARTRGGS